MNPSTSNPRESSIQVRTQSVDALSGMAIGRVLRDRYVLEERLGTSGRGSVFKARDRFRATLPNNHQYVALKVLSVGGISSEQLLTHLRQEFYCGQFLSNGNIVNVYDLDHDGDIFFFTMEMLDGEPLRNIIRRLRPAAMRRSQAWQLIHQLGAGLAHAHERGVVHGDLTPSSIFITREGELRIMNFGAPYPAGSASISGTSAYASCEQLEGRHPDPSDDVYALACICYELLAGVHPFESRAATLARDYRVNAARPEGLSSRQWRALQKGLSWHRAGRSITVTLWMQRLMSDRHRGPHSKTPLRELTPANVTQSKMPWRAAALFFLTASLAAAAFLTQSRSTSSLDTAASAVIAPASGEQREAASVIGSSPPANASAASDSAVTQAGVLNRNDSAVAPATDAPRPPSLVLSVEPSRVRSDDHFAEVRLRRSLLEKGGSFTWWTEPGTAKAGVDYLPEASAIQAFPSGYNSTRVYVKLLPQPLRSQRSYFYVAISEPRHHGRPVVIRRQIWLPTASSLQARR
jgi:serine/threonine protein kinase